ncbi:type II toxin-antitoxin system VapC family toxin [Shinella zoogloeoides]|uniref:type II toxin-antitoxin system VapC family toxin n=1 Tax=Shinella zoogloeoides TaxID=352475 RepID=UPI00273ED845|nr:type II toxin-antitoxin system VapC family toxin [Shinella zoogloeoides]WLR93565.1 type II toxin-antitoxin system VapC family toxin [Shinella zoogloeoides]
MYLLDTNVLSEARRGSPQAVKWLRSVEPDRLHLSVITLGEIMRGIALKERSDPQAAAHLSAWLQRLRRDHAARILPISDRIAVEWGRLSALRPRGGADGLIAATAIVHELVVVTRNIADFADTGAACLNPWDL